MSSNDRLQKLQDAAKEYLVRERKILNAEYDFIDKILKARGYFKVDDANNQKASELLIKSLKDFLE